MQDEPTDTAANGDAADRRAQVLPLDWTQLAPAANAPQIRYPSDVTDLLPEETEIVIIGTAGQKITHIGPTFSETVNPEATQLILRSHLIKKMEGLEKFSKLELLELYDNQIDALACVSDGDNGAPGRTIQTLDMSYNVIREMRPVMACPNLTELCTYIRSSVDLKRRRLGGSRLCCYRNKSRVNCISLTLPPFISHNTYITDLANNKVKVIEGLSNLIHLKKIDLGANRVRSIPADEFANLTNLQELWLGKNKIEKIEGLEKLVNLRRLDVQSNRLTKIEGLTAQNESLVELYLAHNGIDTVGATKGLSLAFPNLNVLDLSRNKLTAADPFVHLTSLEELWLSGNEIETFDDVKCLASLGQTLDTIYLEYNPLQKDPLYRKKLHELIPSLSQIDANLIHGLQQLSNGVSASVSDKPVVTEEQRIKQLQDAVVARAKEETKQTREQGRT
jgi:protein phosphatase 1 regulatory subunit 7